jgi:hypothetical protein
MEVIHNSEEKGLLSENQFGSHKAKLSQTPVFLEILQHDLSRMTRKQDGQINYNAKACYNCILPNLASLISQRFGVHGNEVRLHHHLLKTCSIMLLFQNHNKNGLLSTVRTNLSMEQAKAMETAHIFGQ